MTTATLQPAARPVNFSRSDLYAVAAVARRKVATNGTMLRAIERALVNLAGGQFSYDGQQVVLASASSSERYVITVSEPMTCTCKGRSRGYTCWHLVAARLIVRAAERNASAQPATVAVATVASHSRPTDVQAAVDELFA